jgi:addiction module RelE/StbE family toxin
MTWRIVWSQAAHDNRREILRYIAERNPEAAVNLNTDFKAALQQAKLHPEMYKPGRVEGTREIVVRPNYIIVYCVEDASQIIHVVAVLHAAQQWPAG